MAVDLSNTLVIGVSSRALFNLEYENEIFKKDGLKAFNDYQYQNEEKVLKKGTAFPLVEALLNLNKDGERIVEVVIMSKNSPDVGMRIFNSIKEYRLDINRSVFTGGENLAPYLGAYSVDLFLSKNESDVQTAIDNGSAAAVVYSTPDEAVYEKDCVKFAFDADAVIFSDESEQIYKEKGLDAFIAHEIEKTDSPLNEGPFAKLVKVLSKTQEISGRENSPIKMGIVTARDRNTGFRIIKTLRNWGVYIDSAFFLGGVPKDEILKAYYPHFFFDDQDTHVGPASKIVPSGRVPYNSNSKIIQITKDS